MPGDSDIYRGQVDQRTPLNVALCAIWYRLWQLTGFSSSGSGGIVVVPPTVSGVTVVGIQEVFTQSGVLSTASTVIPAGALSITVVAITGFVGTIGGAPWQDVADATHAGGTFNYTAAPGNLTPAITVTRSAGSYIILQSRPT